MEAGEFTEVQINSILNHPRDDQGRLRVPLVLSTKEPTFIPKSWKEEEAHLREKEANKDEKDPLFEGKMKHLKMLWDEGIRQQQLVIQEKYATQ